MFRFFIDRPIFATVLAVLVTLAGALAVRALPLSQYPNVTPPTIQVDCNYPGASSEVVAKTVAAPIEQRVNGVERMLYMAAQCTSDGTYTLTITFETGTDLNLAQVLVQNRVNLALPELPEVVRATGVTARKRSPEILLTFALMSPTDKYDQVYLSNYASLQLKEVLTRIDGISDVTIFGQRDFSMRVWVNPDKLEARDLTVLDVVNAVRGQSAEVAMGAVGGGGSRFTVTALGRLEDVGQFEDVIVKVGADGQVIRVRDVAEVMIGARSNDITNRFDGKQTVGLAIFLQPDANALATAEVLKATMDELSKEFPEGIKYELGYDTTPYIRASIDEVYKSLRDSVILVAIVVMLFLQSWRSALIPLATVPVAVIGTFAALLMFGYGLNTLTLFGLVLAVGIVVDDAIVVVEAVQQQIEKGYAPREATLRAMAEVSGPVVAVGLVLSAVFVPCMFFPGIVGLFFKQFALTIAVSTLISTFNSLTLSPALCAILLKPKAATPDVPQRVLNGLLGWFFRLFNRTFDVGGRAYTWGVARLLRVAVLVLVGYGGMLAFTAWWYQGAPLEKGRLVMPAFAVPFTGADVPAFDFAEVADALRLPTGFIPEQDKGFLIASVQLPDAASAERTRAVIDKVAVLAKQTPGVRHVNAVAGNSFVLSAYGSNFGSMFIILDPFDERRDGLHATRDIVPALRKRIEAAVPEAQINIFGAAAVPGLGRAGGMRLMIQDRGEVGPRRLYEQTDELAKRGAAQPSLTQVFTAFRVTAPQLLVTVDFAACAANGVAPLDVYATMQATLGQRYVNDFNKFGRTWQVNVQAVMRHRDQEEDVKRLKVRSKAGALVPLRALCDVKAVSGPPVITRYNMYPAAALTASVAPGKSSGEAIAVLERLADEQLPRSMGAAWTELTFIEQRSKDTGLFVFLLAVAVVFLVLAALYESWALPFAVILVVPTCVLSSLVGVYFAKQDVNLFTQVGFVVLIGLACKNAILIVEYAKWKREEGADRREAVLAACRQRLRPILMTSFAFILGVAPLAFASGAGAEMRTALGVAVFAGMIGVTAFGIFLTPVFYVVVDRLTEGHWGRSAKLRRVGTVLRWALAFGWVRPLIRTVAARR